MRVVASAGREIVLVGTAHVSRESTELVRRVIEAAQPDGVCIELDVGRYDALSKPQRFEHLIEHASAVPRFCRVEDEFSAVPGANDSGHARILCQRGAAVALMQIQSKIRP